ncbi:hypothetical protein F511_01768 [Dorcoceras hygrometricum]|uniref:RRM domain-containing protein n=1 Tax=Dorcoceras hygrometricum TaxID=472368 RepID=A0A2Z7ASB1_9LAMI|nr:hypothetical protein F511_01768 [Dorcoceras hygrometricum]
MAAKEETEGRCPACRTIYDKEKIVAMQTECGRAMSKSSNRKNKPPKVKPKTTEVKKDLTNVRVIQRKMVYVIGLPLSLADEDLLQRKEYFGQYGKVDKVSLSRTAGGAIQQFVNETCSVYITYSKEEEAIRCIQSVHGFVLEGRFLRASFGTAKYCHAWLKNMPCNNPACLYLHSIGADEDSFGKDEVAAVHTRSRVQQIVGAIDNVVTRSGDVLPPPVDDLCSSNSAFTDRFTVQNTVDVVPGSVNGKGEIIFSLPSTEKQGGIAAPHKMTTFVDIVGRSNCPDVEKDRNINEDRVSKLCSELSSVTTNGEIHGGQPYSFPNLFRVSSSNHVENGLSKNIPDRPAGEDSLLFEDQGPRDLYGPSQKSCFQHPSYVANILEDACGPALLHNKTRSLGDFTGNHYKEHNREDEVSLPIRCVNSVLSDAWQEMKFQNSSKSDKIYRSSSSFSNEEIVEHLRRLDDGNLPNDDQNSGLEAVESSIISNIMSMDFDPWEGSLTKTNDASEFCDETRGLNGGSSWNTLNSDQSAYSYFKSDGFGSHVAGSVLRDFGDNKEHYLRKPQYTALLSGTRAQSLAPPGFAVPSRDPPPGFSASERTGNGMSRIPSGSPLVNSDTLSSTFLQLPSTEFSSSTDNVNFINSAVLTCGVVKPMNGQKIPGFEMKLAPNRSAYEDDKKLWVMMQQQSLSAHKDSKLNQLFALQTPSLLHEFGHTNHMGNELSLDHIYGLPSRLVDQHQNYVTSSLTQLSQQKYANGHLSNTNGYHRHSFDDFQRKSDMPMTELGRNERLGVNKYFPGYGDLMFSSGDV